MHCVRNALLTVDVTVHAVTHVPNIWHNNIAEGTVSAAGLCKQSTEVKSHALALHIIVKQTAAAVHLCHR